MKKRVHAFYTGRVQGVGFRMTAEDTARKHGVVGWVKNLRGGRVELVAEAEEAVLQQFLEALRNGPMRNFIGDVELAWSNASETFNEFEILYY
jgi:acylphosphatase